LDVDARSATAVRSEAEDEGPKAPKQSLRAHHYYLCLRTLSGLGTFDALIRTPDRQNAEFDNLAAFGQVGRRQLCAGDPKGVSAQRE
jgi:hypothetical protein